MAEQVINEMISAFSIGCMDQDNFANFKEYIDSKGELPYEDLGELQNLMAMIPLILEIETPDPKLKDTVAKKLIGMQNEIKARIKEEKVKTAAVKETVSKTEVKEEIKKTEVTKTTAPTAVDTKRETLPREKTGPQKRTEPRYTSQPRKKTEQRYTSQPPVNVPQQDLKKKSMSGYALWGGLGVVALLLVFIAFYFYDINKSLNSDVANLKEEITTLQDEISSNRDFIADYNSLIEFFSYQDIAVVDLAPADDNSDAFGKLFISYGQLKGLLELNKMPSISPEEVYQLWVVSRGVSYSLGVFRPSFNDRYFEIPQIPYVSKEELDLARITLEPRTGSDTPQGQTQLFGIISDKPVRKRR